MTTPEPTMDHGEEPGIMDLVHSVDQQLLIALSHLDDALAMADDPGLSDRLEPAQAIILAELERRHQLKERP